MKLHRKCVNYAGSTYNFALFSETRKDFFWSPVATNINSGYRFITVIQYHHIIIIVIDIIIIINKVCSALYLLPPYLTSWHRFVQIDKTPPPHPPHTTYCAYNKILAKSKFAWKDKKTEEYFHFFYIISLKKKHLTDCYLGSCWQCVYFQFAFNLGSGEARLVYNSTRVDDGLWHRIRATRLDQTASLMVIMLVAKTKRMMMHKVHSCSHMAWLCPGFFHLVFSSHKDQCVPVSWLL